MSRQRSVKWIFSFSSGVRMMFWTAAAALGCAMGTPLLLDAASGRDDLLAGGRAHRDAADRDRLGDLPVGEDLRRPLAGGDEPGLGERLGGDLRPRGHARQVG